MVIAQLPKPVFRIAPFTDDGEPPTWMYNAPNLEVFDEPLVRGTDELIHQFFLAHNAEPKRNVGVISFADRPFKPLQDGVAVHAATYEGAENDGSWYRVPVLGPGKRAWLCAVLFRYYEKAPKKLYFSFELLTPRPLTPRHAKVLRAMVSIGGVGLSPTDIGLAAGVEQGYAPTYACSSLKHLINCGVVVKDGPGLYSIRSFKERS